MIQITPEVIQQDTLPNAQKYQSQVQILSSRIKGLYEKENYDGVVALFNENSHMLREQRRAFSSRIFPTLDERIAQYKADHKPGTFRSPYGVFEGLFTWAMKDYWTDIEGQGRLIELEQAKITRANKSPNPAMSFEFHGGLDSINNEITKYQTRKRTKEIEREIFIIYWNSLNTVLQRLDHKTN